MATKSQGGEQLVLHTPSSRQSSTHSTQLQGVHELVHAVSVLRRKGHTQTLFPVSCRCMAKKNDESLYRWSVPPQDLALWQG